MERNIPKETEIKRDMPLIQVPAIKFIPYKNKLYVQMNIKSYIEFPERKLSLYRGFLFEVNYEGFSQTNVTIKQDPSEIPGSFLAIKISQKSLPKIGLVNNGDFPLLFHPHFVISSNPMSNKVYWVDYKREIPEKDIGSYILRVARSLKYEKGYIDLEAQKTNKAALNWYLQERDSGKFPTDDIQIPSAKTFKIASNNINNQQYSVSNRTESLAVQNSIQSDYPRRNLKFEIKESHPPYSPEEKIQPDFSLYRELDSDYRNDRFGSLSHQLYLTKTAFDAIAQHIGWDRRTEQNIVEQGGILLGEVFRDPLTTITYAVAEHAIAGRSARGTSGYIEMTHETWKEMFDEVDRLNTGLNIIGWYHTHPNSLDVFMSGTDKATQARVFNHDWQFAIVLNPHSQIWRSFYGKNSLECQGYVIKESQNQNLAISSNDLQSQINYSFENDNSTAINIHTVDPVEHERFLNERRRDTYTKDLIRAGDTIVFCAGCESAFLHSSWQLMQGRHCNQQDTLHEFLDLESIETEPQNQDSEISSDDFQS